MNEIEKAIAYLKDSIKYAEKCSNAKEVKNIINTAIEALEKQLTDRWIPVSERLPDNQQRVLVSCDKCPVVVGWIMWNEWYTDYGKGYGNINVIAWRSLPETYKEVQ